METVGMTPGKLNRKADVGTFGKQEFITDGEDLYGSVQAQQGSVEKYEESATRGKRRRIETVSDIPRATSISVSELQFWFWFEINNSVIVS